jgi:hypothetical protein
MNALSFRQPWAELVLQGRKALDLRTYGSAYRGPLAIHASKTIEKERCREFDLNPEMLPTGAVVGIVQLVDVRPLNEAEYNERREEHLAGRSYRETLHGWQLADPQRLPEPIPVRGRPRIFNVDLDESGGGYATTAPQDVVETKQAAVKRDVPADIPFTLEVHPENQHEYTLILRQRVVIEDENQPSGRIQYGAAPAKLTTIVTLGGPNLRSVAGQVLNALRESGYKPTDLSPSRKKPFQLPEQVGVRLGLLFLAVRPLRKMSRVEEITHGINRMAHEEAYYWYSKCTSTETSERAQRALRVLLAVP